MESNPQAVLMEAVHVTAFNGGLGNPLIASSSALKARPRRPSPISRPPLRKWPCTLGEA